jgi:hypothetical protein
LGRTLRCRRDASVVHGRSPESIVPGNRTSAQLIRDGRVVGYSEKGLTEYRQLLIERYRQLRSATTRTAAEDRLLRGLEEAIPERFR